MQNDKRYKAFISYSHQDRRWARWLHRALERYRAPRRLGLPADVAAHLRPIFRDRDELSAGPDLGDAIRRALDDSTYLIVLCSPAASASRWVAAELAHFLATRTVANVLCVIVGPPGRVGEGSGGTLACLPDAMRVAYAATAEPLAIDLRPGGDGRRLARLKLAAGMLGVGLDTLVQRDAARRLRWMTGTTAAALLLSGALGALTIAAIDARSLAQRHAAESEDLVAFMLGDLRAKLEPVGRLDVLDGVGRKVLLHYDRVGAATLDDAALAQQSRALTLLGSIGVKRGHLVEAERAFTRAAASATLLSDRRPRDGPLLFDRMQTIYWLAYVQWQLGNLAPAERGFTSYADLADTLVHIDPTRADWRREPAYARSNLGTLLLQSGRFAEALAAFEIARARFRTESDAAPADRERLADLVDAQNWVADSLYRLGRLRDAYRERRATSRLLQHAVATDPRDQPLAATAYAADLTLARRGVDLGRLRESGAVLATARAGLARLVAFDPANADWLEYAAAGDLDRVDLALGESDVAAAAVAHDAARRALARLSAVRGATYRWQPRLAGRWQRQAIELAQAKGERGAARRGARLLRIAAAAPHRDTEPGEVATLRGFAEIALDRPAAAAALLTAHAELLPASGRDLLARALLQSAQRGKALSLFKSLCDEGYRHPAFLGYWSGGAAVGQPLGKRGFYRWYSHGPKPSRTSSSVSMRPIIS